MRSQDLFSVMLLTERGGTCDHVTSNFTVKVVFLRDFVYTLESLEKTRSERFKDRQSQSHQCVHQAVYGDRQ